MLYRLINLISVVSIVSLAGCASTNTFNSNDELLQDNTLDVSSKEIQSINALPSTKSGGELIAVEKWDKMWGKNVRAMTRNQRYPAQPTSEEPIYALDFMDSKGDKYGQRVQAYIEVPVTGEYVFWVSADQSAEVWLGSDAKPENKRLVAFVNKPSGYQIWDTFKTQKSRPQLLEEGTKYYFEVLHKEHIGVDYLSVAWNGPNFERRIITSESLSQFVSETMSEVVEGPSYEEGYHVGYQAGSMLAPYDNQAPAPDTDGDGLPDFYENIIGLNSQDSTDANSDLDGDLLSALEEYTLLSNPKSSDTDGDGLPDGFEVLVGLNASYAGDALLDLDGDGVSNLDEYAEGTEPDNANSFPVVSDIALTWNIPKQRADGTELNESDIRGYKIYILNEEGVMEEIATVEGYDINHLELNDKEKGSYQFAISTITNDGIESEMSSLVTLTI